MIRVWTDRPLGRYANDGTSVGRDTENSTLISEELDLENLFSAGQLSKMGAQLRAHHPAGHKHDLVVQTALVRV